MLNKRQADILAITLQDGVLKDEQGRTGYIAANHQFQFDGPPQTGAIYTAGWSICADNHLTLGSDDTFYSCLSGNFYNLYDEAEAAQCNKVYINAIMASGASGAAGAQPDGQPTGSAVASQISDGQPQATPVSTTAAASQISDGQIQASPVSTSAVASQISDGQIQASPVSTTAAPVSQISDGQIQAPTSAPVVSQIGDGQIQAPTGGAAPAANSTMVYPSVPVQTGNTAAGIVAPGLSIFAAILGFAVL